MLHGDAAAEPLDALDVAVSDGLGVIEEPAEGIDRHLAVHFFQDVEEARDRLVVGRVQPEGPLVLGEEGDDLLEFGFHRHQEIGPGFKEILEIGGREDQHLAGAVAAIVVVTGAWRGHFIQRAKSCFSSLGFWVNRL